MDHIIQYVRGSVVMHNLLRHDDGGDDWIDLTDLTEGEDDLDPEPATTPSNTPNYERRNKLFYYLSELQNTTIN